MRRHTLPLLALLAAAGATGAAAAPDPDAHRHPGSLFQLRFEPVMNTAFVYRAYLADPDPPAGLIIERADGWLGDAARRDVTPASCPAAAALVMRLASLPLPPAALENTRPYDMRAPTPAVYHFAGFASFPNGGEAR